MRWTYAYNASKNTIVNFQPDSVIPNYPNAAFPFYQLTEFSVFNYKNQLLMNASTILTVDLSNLNKQNIKNIYCGSSAVYKTVPVNISILQPSFPFFSHKVYASVIVRYESGLVSSMDVSWRKFQVSIEFET